MTAGTRRTSGLVLAAMCAAASALLAAPPASAASTASITIDCAADTTIYGTPGDTVIVTLGTGCPDGTGGFGAAADGYLDNPTSVVDGTLFRDLPRNWWVYSDGSGTTTITTLLMATSTAGGITVGAEVGYYCIDGGGCWQLLYGGPRTLALGAGEAPAAWFQAYARPDQASDCEAGYSASWALWPNGGTGGWTCERAIVWDPSTRTWVSVAGSHS